LEGKRLSITATKRDILDAAGCSRDRVATLASYAEGRRTLDVGCTGARPAKGHTEASLARHLRIAQGASACLGIDLDEEGVAELNRRGFRAQVADACTCELGETFETIVAGELIEHLPDPAAFFGNMRRHLAAGGRLALSTCNPFCSKQLFKILRHGRPAVHPEHTAWYDPLTLMRLATHFGFEPLELIWIRERRGFDLRMLPRLFRKYFSENFVLVLGVGAVSD